MNWYQTLKNQMAERPAPGSNERVARVVVPSGARGTARGAGAAQRFVILPRGLRADSAASANFLAGLSGRRPAGLTVGTRKVSMNLIASLHENGAKLAEMSPESAKLLQAANPGLLVVPEVFYQPAVHLVLPARRPSAGTARGGARPARRGARAGGRAATRAAARVARVTVTVRDASGRPLKEAAVVAFADFANREGVDGVTNASGKFSFSTQGFTRIERLYVFPRMNHWSVLRRNVALAAEVEVRPRPLDLAFTDCVRHFYGGGADSDGAGVKVAVVDSGVALDHPDLVVAGGACTIEGEDPDSFGALGGEHGTHVAGIIAGRGSAPSGVRGVAPAVEVFSYRVFNPDEGASNFSIIGAIDAAVEEGCDLINMSLGGGPRDPATEAAIVDARRAGCVCVVAAGNDNRSGVSQPAAFSQCVAVSACGRRGTFPAGTADVGDVAPPAGDDPADFIAAFSNVGPEIDVTGPGVAVISTVPGGHAPMSGTSMACPAVAGLAARLLSRPQNAALRNATRDVSRADAIVRMVFESCRPLGFGPNLEGQGLPRS